MAKLKIKWNKWHRLTHYWGALACALPFLVVILSGILLLLKKESHWIQPITQQGSEKIPTLSFDQILDKAQSIPEAEIKDWDDVKILDVRPSAGIIKIQSNNRWEIQLDAATGETLQVAFRRSDLIEELHDGSYFHDKAKLAIFLPSAIIVFVLWITGMYLFISKQLIKFRRKSNPRASNE